MFDMARPHQPRDLAALVATLADLAARIDRVERLTSLDAAEPGGAGEEWVWEGNRAWRRPSSSTHQPRQATHCREPRPPKPAPTRLDLTTASSPDQSLIDNFIEGPAASAA